MNKASYFLIGVAGTGMSALAQYLAQAGHQVAGSDRQFAQPSDSPIQQQLQNQGIACFPQDASGIQADTDYVVISTAIEKDNVELMRAQELNLVVLHRSELLQQIAQSRKTIAISGTSGKSTVTGMVWHILQETGMHPSLISGAGLSELEAQGKIGNAVYDSAGEWLVIEADESDGSLVQYHPEIGVILNVDKDHKELHELEQLFTTFASHTRQTLIVNGDHPLAQKHSRGRAWEFGHEGFQGFQGLDFEAVGTSIRFRIRHQGNLIRCEVPVPGEHNMYNALAAIAVSRACGQELRSAAQALKTWGGIHRRHQIVDQIQGITLVDDYAHNPAKIAASIRACQAFTAGRIIAWFQPHGFGPTRFLRKELAQEMAQTLRSEQDMNHRDLMFFSQIYYAGGTAVQDISGQDLADDLKALKVDATYIQNRDEAAQKMVAAAFAGDTILLMGARDPSLADFAQQVRNHLRLSCTCV